MKTLENFRKEIRQGLYRQHTCGFFNEKAQFNLVILPEEFKDDFVTFCKLNPKPCPLIFQSKPGQYLLAELGEIDIRTDVPAYLIYREGELNQEKESIQDLWRDDFVVFLIGCSFTFEFPLIEAGIKLKHIAENKNVAMYKTNIKLNSSEYLFGNMVASMRWIKPDQIDTVVKISEQYPGYHGGPIHIGNYRDIGIKDIVRPDYGDYVEPDEGDIPVFWACGVTPQNCLKNSKYPLVITHKPGAMLISDLNHQQALLLAKLN